MNERIKLLAEQARDWGYAEHSGYTAQLLFEEKFAELIVEECAQRAEAYAYMSQNFTALAEELRRMKQNG